MKISPYAEITSEAMDANKGDDSVVEMFQEEAEIVKDAKQVKSNLELQQKNELEDLDLAANLENWMTQLPEELKHISIIYLAIPGTHDSGTYSINKHSELAPDAEPWMVQLKWLGIILTTIMSNWSKTQDYIIMEQLHAGIRFFDLRVATKPNDVLHIVHSLYAVPVSEVLADMKNYLDSHPKEVLILDFQHFYAMNESDHVTFIQAILDTFGERIVPSVQNRYMKHLTMEYLHQNRYQVIVIYRWNTNFHQFFPSTCYPTPWPNTTDMMELLDKLTKGINGRNSNFGYVSQFLLTPDGLSVFKNLCCGTLKTFSAIPLIDKCLDWVKEQTPGFGGVNVIIGDFIDLEAVIFAKSVINLNQKLLLTSRRTSSYEGNELPSVTA